MTQHIDDMTREQLWEYAHSVGEPARIARARLRELLEREFETSIDTYGLGADHYEDIHKSLDQLDELDALGDEVVTYTSTGCGVGAGLRACADMHR